MGRNRQFPDLTEQQQTPEEKLKRCSITLSLENRDFSSTRYGENTVKIVFGIHQDLNCLTAWRMGISDWSFGTLLFEFVCHISINGNEDINVSKTA